RAGRLQPLYRQEQRPPLGSTLPDRRIFAGKRYLPIGLVEAGRGCHFRCEFCAVQAYFHNSQTRRPTEAILEEIRQSGRRFIFFVDDNITSNLEEAKNFFRELAKLKVRWVSQASINAAHDEEFLHLIKASGCQGLLIGFETLNPNNLRLMHKGFNTMKGGYEVALANLRRYGIRLYTTFILGYDDDTPETFRETLAFAQEQRFFMVAFNHLTPFPGTPLYQRLKDEGRMLYEPWWLHPDYRYGMLPYHPRGLTPDEVQRQCVVMRGSFYSLPSMLRRSLDVQVNTKGPFMWWNFFVINWLMRREVLQRHNYPLGDATYQGELLKTNAWQEVECET
ncbi:MAG: B12-binding domain-containing radical SAM protein, partial [Chloroflexaceae bacterium]|nr:B12-binding domain-containing radical SAM protein [Chloroflexaceae bacterium]